MRARIGVMEIGLKSAQTVGGVTFGMGWMMAVFRFPGRMMSTTTCCTDVRLID